MRPALVDSYVQNMTDFLVRTKNMNRKDAEDKVREIARERVQNHTVEIQDTNDYGNLELKNDNLYQLIDRNRGNVIVPSGSIYYPSTKKEGVINQFLKDKKDERAKYKNAQFEAQARGDKESEKILKAMQKVVKVVMNALPGGFASPHNLFYDKGGYNTITSLARSLISISYTVAEQLLCGIFGWFEEDDVITHIINTLKDAPTEQEVNSVLNQFNLKEPSRDELLKFFYSVAGVYHGSDFKMPTVETMTANLANHEVTFLYYFFNLKHIFYDNFDAIKPWIDKTLDINNIPPASESDSNMDEDLLVLVTTMIHEYLQEAQVEEELKNNTDFGKWITAVAHHVQSELNKFTPVLDTFVKRKTGFPRLNRNKYMIRESVIISDTDSTIFTLKQWVQWYYQKLEIDATSLSFSAFMVYLLTKVNANEMWKFGERHEVGEENCHIAQMKNEFIYPTLLLFDKKKTYAGIVAIQEGNVLKELDTDVKGTTLKGSSVSEDVNDFIENLLKEDICKTSMKRKLSAMEMIQKVTDFERKIYTSLKKGETNYLRIANIRDPSEYKDALATQYFSYLAWQHIFAEKYGDHEIPVKTTAYKIVDKIPKDYMEWLSNHYPDIAQKFIGFKQEYKKDPTYILSNPISATAPEEIIPIIDIRGTLKTIMGPIYDILIKIGIPAGYFRKQNLLLSDFY